MLPLPPPLVSFDLCAPVAELLKAASQDAVPMRAAPEIAGDTLYVRLKDVPATEFRSRLAAMLHATWGRSSDGGLLLARTREDRREVEAIERRETLRALASDFARLDTPRTGDATSDAQAYIAALARDAELQDKDDAPRLRGPADGLLDDILLGLGPEALAAIPVREQINLSDHPTPRERPFPAAIAPALARYEATDAAFGRLVSEELANRLSPDWRESLIGAARKVGVSRVLLKVARSEASLGALLATYDRAGAMRGTAFRAFDLAPTPPPVAGDGTDAIPAGDEAACAALALPWNAPAPALLPYLDPVARDPLEMRALPVLRAMSGNLLVALPDRAARETAVAGVRTAADFRAALARCGVRLRAEGGWTLGEPTSPGALDRTCLSRPELRRWIALGRGRGLPAVRALARLYARGGPAVSGGGFRDLYSNTILPHFEGESRVYSLHRELLRALGTLSDAEWGRLERGEPIPVLPDAARAEGVDDWTKVATLMLSPLPGREVADVLKTGTAAFPNGLPPETRLVLERRSEVVVRNGAGHWSDVANTLPALLWKRTLPDPNAGPITDEAIARTLGDARFAEARREVLRFRAAYGAAPVESLGEVPSAEATGVREGLRYDELSAEAREAYRGAIDRWRDDAAKRPKIKP